MRDIKSGYMKKIDKYPYHGGYLCLAKTIKGRRFSRKNIIKALDGLVPKDDFLVNERKGLVDHLEYLTNIAEEGEI